MTTDLSQATVVTLYLLSSSNLKLRPILTRQLKPGARIVAHNFAMGDWEAEKIETFTDRERPDADHLPVDDGWEGATVTGPGAWGLGLEAWAGCGRSEVPISRSPDQITRSPPHRSPDP